jgi:hypothetical protein
MTYSVGNSEVANYANTSSGQVTNVAADNGLGGAGVATNVVDRVALSFVVSTNIQFLTVDVTSLDDYVAGITDVTITVNPNVYVYGTYPTQQFPIPGFNLPTAEVTVPDASMQIIGGAAGDTIKLVNNGNIVGFGGDGGCVQRFVQCGGTGITTMQDSNALSGNAALSLITPGISVTIENNGYIAGGGGGGGKGTGFSSGAYSLTPGGGGGAGGGISGVIPSPGGIVTRAVPPNAGNNGIFADQSYTPCGSCCTLAVGFHSGGGGGFVLPGTGGVAISGVQVSGIGGGAGGSGAALASSTKAWDNNGGGANNPAPTYTLYSSTTQGGGGGGWGAAGAAGYTEFSVFQVGAAGGNSIVTNGNAYTMLGDGNTRLYGTVNTATTSVVYTFPATVETGTTLDLAAIPGYTTGTNVVLMVPSSVRLASNDTSTPGLTITKSGSSNDPSSVRVVLNGAILGAGGAGGSETITAPNASMNAGVALTLPNIGAPGVTWIIDNTNGYIAGGGGGGGRGQNNASLGSATIVTYGGGGAGLTGSSGVVGNAAYNAGLASGVASGTNGTNVVVGSVTYSSGGSGGTILPGTLTSNIGPFLSGVIYPGLGGTAGGAGALSVTVASSPSVSNRGGGFNISGGAASTVEIGSGCAGGGGGGWGRNGGNGRRSNTTVSVGGTGGVTIKYQNTNTKLYVVNLTNLAGFIAP